MTPFSLEQFLEVFAEYNRAVFPIQAVLVAMALVGAVLATKRFSASNKFVSLVLAALWIWMGIVYHLLFFAEINPAAFLFAALFIAQGFLFFYEGVVLDRLSFLAEKDLSSFAGLILILYALIVYPIVGYARGGAFPAIPTFGLPCPTTIFTFAILLWADKRVPPHLLIIPFLWSLIGVYVAAAFGVVEDYALPAVGIITTAILLYPGSRRRVKQYISVEDRV